MSESTTTQELESCLARLRAGDARAHEDLWALVDARLTTLTRKMLRESFPRLRQWEQTDDVAQNAKMRLLRALKDLVPASARDFYGLANLQIRRELLNRIRHLTGRGGEREPARPIERGPDVSPIDPSETTMDPGRLAMWQEFHEAVDRLPPPEREVCELHWYQGLSLDETAQVLEVDKSTAKRRWRSARLKLALVLPDA